MQVFKCQGCGSALDFRNSQCVSCGRAVGYMQDRGYMGAIEGARPTFQALGAAGETYRYCDNEQFGVCNWLVPAQSSERFCASCRHNNVIPDLSVTGNAERWGKIELAKRYVIRSVLRWNLPHPNRYDDPENGLAFDFLSDAADARGNEVKVLTGHDNGLITINVAEADDGEREKLRTQMHEPYRTLVGHFRHEIGHYYWDRLVRDGGRLEECRAVFGDDTQDYGEALKRHYREGAPVDWRDRFISAYATTHPWEDFAETWAHYLHIVDALETARSFGIRIDASGFMPNPQAAAIDFNPYEAASAERLVGAWTPLTIAINGVNRSMGHLDLYPFVLNVEVMRKLAFVHDLVARAGRGRARSPSSMAA